MKYLVTDTGFGTGLDIRPNPGIGFPGYRQLLPGDQGNPGTAEDPLSRRPGTGPVAALPRSASLRRTGVRAGRNAALPAATRRTAATAHHRQPRDSHEGQNRPRRHAGGAVHRDVPGLHVRARDGVRAVPIRRAYHLQRGVHECVGTEGRQLRPHRRCRGRKGQEHDPAQGRHGHGRLRHRQGTDADRGHQGGRALREPDR